VSDKKIFDGEQVLAGLKVKESVRTKTETVQLVVSENDAAQDKVKESVRTKTETVQLVVSENDAAQDFVFEVHKRFNVGLPDDWIYRVVYECLCDGDLSVEPPEPPVYYSELASWLTGCSVAWDYVDELIETDFDAIEREHGLWGILTQAYARFAADVYAVVCELLGIKDEEEE